MKFTLINSHAERREGLKALLRQIDRQGQFNEAKDWRQARHADRAPRSGSDRDRLAGQHATRRSARPAAGLRPGIPAAVLVDDVTHGHARRLLMAGALGVVPRSLDPQLLVRALEMVLLGGHYVPAGALDPDLAVEFAPRRFAEPAKLLPSHTTLRHALAAPAADHALRPHGQHQQGDREDARHQRRHGQDPSCRASFSSSARSIAPPRSPSTTAGKRVASKSCVARTKPRRAPRSVKPGRCRCAPRTRDTPIRPKTTRYVLLAAEPVKPFGQ